MCDISEEEIKVQNELCEKLKELNIDHVEYKHPKAANMEELNKYIGDKIGAKCKNLLIKDKKKNETYLLTVLGETKVNLKLLGKKLGNLNLRLADDETLLNLLHVYPGSVTPLALMHDTEGKVIFLIDESLKKENIIFVHPMHNKSSLAIRLEDLIKYVEKYNHKPVWINFDQDANTDIVENEKDKNDETNVIDSTLLGITVKKSVNFSEWYTQVVVRSEMIEYYDISGCYVLRPWAFYVWEIVQNFFDKEIKKLGVENCYFPMFVSKNKLETEKNHIEGFSPEVAWVTKYGENDLSEPIAIRPTSETIMYPSYAKWIRSHRDLPLLLNMWNTVVRWEFKQPTPFIRTREFLWQEGHTAHANKEEALTMVLDILELYRRWYEEYLAVAVIKGWKSENEKFAGGEKTSTIETFISSNGRAIQAATSHLLGTNFAKMFNIIYEDDKGNKQFAWQTSWGCTTRSLGVMIMQHGDDNGLVLPPKVASVQVIIIPITYKDNDAKELLEQCEKVKKCLLDADIRVKVDNRNNYTPGWKYNHWELKGVPIRIEIGTKEVEKKTLRIVRRDNKEKTDIKFDENIIKNINNILNNIQNSLFSSSKKNLDDNIIKIFHFKDVLPLLKDKKMILAPWCGIKETEDEIRKITQKELEAWAELNEESSTFSGGMKTLCIPFDQPEITADLKCFYTEKPATVWALWGRSY